MEPFATIDELTTLWRELKPDEIDRANALLKVVSDTLRFEAEKVGKDLDLQSAVSRNFESVLKSVTVDIVARTLMTSTDQEPMIQSSESALGYSTSGTFLVPGGGLFIKNSELSRLVLKQQRWGAFDIYGTMDQGNDGRPRR